MRTIATIGFTILVGVFLAVPAAAGENPYAMDDDFFETTTIEASSVYVDKIGTCFDASAVDEEDDFVTVLTNGTS